MSTKPQDTDLDEDLDAGAGADTGLPAGQANPLDMSDEDFLRQGAPAAGKTEQTVEKPAVDADEDGDQGAGDGTSTKATAAEPGEGSGASQDPHAGEGKDPKDTKTEVKPDVKAGEKDPAKDPAAEDPNKPAADKKEEKKDEKPDAPLEMTAKAAAYDRLMAPFKANGREIQARSVEDAIALMQMGANYNKRMAGLKPVIKIAKLLENNGLLDEEKLGFLIDLHAKKPDAINKLVKDSGLNPMDLDPDKAGDYRPSATKVDDREVELDTVLDEIKDSSSYTQTLAVAQGWDAASKKVIGDHPALLKVINDHIERGIYTLISAEVERERTFGRLQGLSDIAAYRQVGDAIQARGGFNHLTQPDGAGQGKSSDAGKVVEPKPKKDDDESRNDKRRALGSPRPAAPSGSTPKDFNPLALSDEDFLKQAAPKYR